MLGRTIADPEGVEGAAGAAVDGLGLLDLDHHLRRRQGAATCCEPAGYEIHHGRVSGTPRSGSVFGTMVHGSLEDDDDARRRTSRRRSA